MLVGRKTGALSSSAASVGCNSALRFVQTNLESYCLSQWSARHSVRRAVYALSTFGRGRGVFRSRIQLLCLKKKNSVTDTYILLHAYKQALILIHLFTPKLKYVTIKLKIVTFILILDDTISMRINIFSLSHRNMYVHDGFIRSRSPVDPRSRDLGKKNFLVIFDDVTLPHGCRIAKFAFRKYRMVMTDVLHGRVCYYNEYL